MSCNEQETSKLTKKQQKALVFKGKVPKTEKLSEGDADGLSPETEAAPISDKAKNKKRKRKNKDATTKGSDSADNPSKIPKKSRFTLFVGNLTFETKKEELEEYLFKHCGKVEARIQHDIKSGKSKGYAFVDFIDSAALARALHLHQVDWNGRKLNFNLTVGGGGKGKARMDKLHQRNERLHRQRERASIRKGGVTTYDRAISDKGMNPERARMLQRESKKL